MHRPMQGQGLPSIPGLLPCVPCQIADDAAAYQFHMAHSAVDWHSLQQASGLLALLCVDGGQSLP